MVVDACCPCLRGVVIGVSLSQARRLEAIGVLRRDRTDLPIRYALLVSLRTAEQDVDLYTPIANLLSIPITSTVPVTVR